jgi:hypothetical protein
VIAGIASIDIVQSTELAERLGYRGSQLFAQFHALVDKVIAQHNGRLYARTEDGATALFGNVASGVYAGIDLLEEIGDLAPAIDDVALYVRIGLTTANEREFDVEPEQRKRGESNDLSRVTELQKNCPVGRIAISRSVYDELGTRQAFFRPGNSQALRQLDAFVYTGRQRVAHRHLLAGLSSAKAAAVPPIHTMRWARLRPVDFSLQDLKVFFQEPLLVVLGETSRHLDSNHGSAATSDATTLMELLARLPANPKITVAVDVWEEAADLAGQRHVLVIGSGLVNAFSFAINDLIQIAHFDKHAGKIYSEIVVNDAGKTLRFGSRALVGRYCGMVVHCISPFNLHRRLLWVAGTTGRGTQAAMRFVEACTLSSADTLAATGLSSRNPPIGAVVTAVGDVDSVDVPSTRGISRFRAFGLFDQRGDYISVGGSPIIEAPRE